MGQCKKSHWLLQCTTFSKVTDYTLVCLYPRMIVWLDLLARCANKIIHEERKTCILALRYNEHAKQLNYRHVHVHHEQSRIRSRKECIIMGKFKPTKR